MKKLSLETRECLHCGTAFEVKKGDPKKFCDHSCSASYNNTRKESKYPVKNCQHCGVEYQNANPKYCSHKCATDNRAKKSIENYVSTWTVKPQSTIPKKYVIATKGYKCECCGISEWMDKPIGLQLDHIDGNADNNHEDNLRLLCPNCHTQQDTYAGKNKNAGNNKPKKEKPPKKFFFEVKLKADIDKWQTIKNNSNIRFGEWGWKVRLGKEIGINGQKVNNWLKRVDPEFLEKVKNM
jgi:hypothetical protein